MTAFHPKVTQLECHGTVLAECTPNEQERDTVLDSVVFAVTRFEHLREAADARQTQLQRAVEQLMNVGRMADDVTAWSDDAIHTVTEETTWSCREQVVEEIRICQVGWLVSLWNVVDV